MSDSPIPEQGERPEVAHLLGLIGDAWNGESAVGRLREQAVLDTVVTWLEGCGWQHVPPGSRLTPAAAAVPGPPGGRCKHGYLTGGCRVRGCKNNPYGSTGYHPEPVEGRVLLDGHWYVVDRSKPIGWGARKALLKPAEGVRPLGAAAPAATEGEGGEDETLCGHNYYHHPDWRTCTKPVGHQVHEGDPAGPAVAGQPGDDDVVPNFPLGPGPVGQPGEQEDRA